MKISYAAITNIYQRRLVLEAPASLMSNVAEDEFSITLTKFKLWKEPKNTANTETCTKEYKVWFGYLIEGCLCNVRDITKVIIGSRGTNLNQIRGISEQLTKGTN